jgi:hypothetical protein
MTSDDERDGDKQVSVRLPAPLHAAIARAAAEQERSVSAQIRFLATRALESQNQQQVAA